MKSNKWVKYVLVVALGAVVVLCAWKIVEKLTSYYNDEKEYEEARNKYREENTSVEEEPSESETEPETDPNPPALSYYFKGDYSEHEKNQELVLWQVDFSYILLPKYAFDFDALIDLNDDVCGWVKIMDTHIDYPVVHSHDNQEYIRMSIDKTRAGANAGSIFSDCRTSRPFLERNTILYGHNQHNGMMFHDIIKYDKQEFANRHPLIYIYLPNGTYQVYQVFSSYYTDCYSETYTLNFRSDQQFEEYLQMLLENSTTNYDIPVTKNDRILTLSTCADDYFEDYGNLRYVVNAVYLYTNDWKTK